MYNLLHKVRVKASFTCAHGALSYFRPNAEETSLIVHLIVLSGSLSSTAIAFHGHAVEWNPRPADFPFHSVHAMIVLHMYVLYIRTYIGSCTRSFMLIY